MLVKLLGILQHIFVGDNRHSLPNVAAIGFKHLINIYGCVRGTRQLVIIRRTASQFLFIASLSFCCSLSLPSIESSHLLLILDKSIVLVRDIANDSK